MWTDLAEIDYAPRPERAAIVAYFAEVVRHYARLGIRRLPLRCGLQGPGRRVGGADRRRRARSTRALLFAAETLGAPLEAVLALRPAGFDYLFNSAKWWDFRAPWLLEQYERFRRIAPSIAFPESHDTPRVAADLAGASDARIEAEYRFRYLFAAFFSSGVMMPLGYEFGWDRALDVVLTRPEHRAAAALRPQRFHRRDQRHQSRRAGAERRRPAAPAVERPRRRGAAAQRERRLELRASR